MASPSDSGMEDETDQQEQCSCFDRILKPLTKQNVIHHYIPLAGGACYTLLSVHITKPSVFRRFTSSDPINVLLSASLAGSCLYVYDRKHLKSALGKQKITFRNVLVYNFTFDYKFLLLLFSLFTAGLFNLGSVLLWAMIRSATTSRDTAVQTARVALAIGSSVLLVKTGMDYLDSIDSQVSNSSTRK